MRCFPPRRWFQFRLSTWFVLVAMLCWAMAEWPFYYFQLEQIKKPGTVPNCHGVCEGFVHYETIPIKRVSALGSLFDDEIDIATLITLEQDSGLARGTEFNIEGPHFNRQALWPALALVAFVAWKSTRIVTPWLIRHNKFAARELSL